MLGSLLPTTFGQACDWPNWRGAFGTGVGVGSGKLSVPEEGLHPTWISAELIPSGNQGGWSSPVLSDGSLFLLAHQQERIDQELKYREFIYCWDAATGELSWSVDRQTHESRFPQSGTPLVRGQRLLYLSADQQAVALNTQNGEVAWQTRLVGPSSPTSDPPHFQSSFAEVNGVAAVYLDRLYGVDLETGEILWKSPNDEQTVVSQSSPMVWNTESGAYFVCNAGSRGTICVEHRSGEIVWELETRPSESTCLIVDGLLIVYGASRSAGVSAFRLDEREPTRAWTTQEFGDAGSSPTCIGDKLFVQGGREVGCLAIDSGDVIWRQPLDRRRPRYTSLVATNDQAIYAFDGLLIFDGTTNSYRPDVDVQILADGWMGTLQQARQRLEIDELERTSSGRRTAQRIWREQVESAGPLPCCTPVIDNGFLYIRLRDRLACYDLLPTR